MLRNYLKIAWRNILKNRLSAFINIAGLGLAVGCCLVVFVFLDWYVNQDGFHSKINKIYVIERIEAKDGNQQFWGNSPAPMAQMLKSDFPQIKNTARLNDLESVIKEGDHVFRQKVSFVDDSFYDMFDFPIKWGNKQTFTEQNSIVLTEELSEKLFGKANAIGKDVNVKFNNNGHEIVENFTVKGVFAKRPKETSFYFSALIPFKKLASMEINKTDNWGQNVNVTFLETTEENPTLPTNIQSKKYVDLYNAANKDTKIVGYHFQPLKTMNFHAYLVNFQRFNGTHIIGLIMLLAIAISILTLVCFNYMNIAVASASNRLKEIGVRKVMGSSRQQIIFQFLLENLILCLIGLGLGLFLAKMLFLPWFMTIADVDLTEKLFENRRLWGALVALLFITVLGGAAYPSFYISSLKPISIVKGNMVLGSRNGFRKSLLGIQFFLTFLGISMALAFVEEEKMARTKPWGYEAASCVVVKLDEATSFEIFKSALKSTPQMSNITGSVQPLGLYSKQMLIRTEGKEETILSMQALPHFASDLGIKIVQGRDLSEEFETDKVASVLVNQAFLKKMNWKTGVGKTIEYENQKYVVVGETNDFRFEDFSQKVAPFMIFGCKPADVRFVYAKAESILTQNAHSSVANIWKTTFPDMPFDYYYQDTIFDEHFIGFTRVAQIMSAASLIMIIVSVSGIFGLALLILGKKMKEISIRKVLGAGMSNISFQVIKEFLSAIGIAFLAGFPISYLLVKSIFMQVSPESQISFLPLVTTLLGLIVMTFFSVAWHLYQAFTANPTEFLKND